MARTSGRGAVVFAAVPPRVAHVFDLGFVLFEPVEVFQEQQPGTLFGVVEFRCAAGFLPEDVVDVLEGLFERGRRLGFFAFLLVWSVDGPPGGLNQGALPVTCCVRGNWPSGESRIAGGDFVSGNCARGAVGGDLLPNEVPKPLMGR